MDAAGIARVAQAVTRGFAPDVRCRDARFDLRLAP